MFSREEAGPDAATLYDRGYRWMVVFSEATGARGDRTFLDVRSFAAAAMTANGPKDEADALRELACMGYQITDLPRDVIMGQRPSTPTPGEGWYDDPTRRFQHRWWDGKHWTDAVSTNGQTFADPIA